MGETNKDDMRLYIRRDNGREYKCKIEGKKVSEVAKSADPPAKHKQRMMYRKIKNPVNNKTAN